ncbi:MAG: hypothetical protein KDG89_02585 [Geminicoccaceae bacterium]|nr:hypothetical protein [Geminicoccaceae bacterium]
MVGISSFLALEPRPCPPPTAARNDPKPRSLAQIEASRKNGAKSLGPRTEAGKAKSAANALKHGLATAPALLAEEDEDAFAQHCLDLEAEYTPSGPTERALVA